MDSKDSNIGFEIKRKTFLFEFRNVLSVGDVGGYVPVLFLLENIKAMRLR